MTSLVRYITLKAKHIVVAFPTQIGVRDWYEATGNLVDLLRHHPLGGASCPSGASFCRCRKCSARLAARWEAFRKGYIAERQIGRALEQAITARGCAVAHNVMGVMDSGDIDHIVVTRRNVWVIETKYRRVLEKAFPKVLRRLHACRQSVEALLPKGTPVRPCLVLAYDGDGVKPDWDGIRVFNNETFGTLLDDLRAERNEAVGASRIDRRVPEMVWQLSRGESPSPVEAAKDRCETHEVGDSNDAPRTRLDEVRSQHPKAYERWTPEDDQRLADLHEAGWDEAGLADEFDRQPSAIRSRLQKLGRLGRRG